MQYYFSIDYYPESKTYLKPLAVFRWYRKDKGSYLEIWDGEKWVNHPGLIAATGIGGDNDFSETTAEKANQFIRAQS